MSNLEPIDERDIDLEGKFKVTKSEKMSTGDQEAPKFSPEKEVKQEIVSAERDAAYGKILAQVQGHAQVSSDEEIKEGAKQAMEKNDAESQVQHLVDVAMQKGLVDAVKMAQHMEDNYVLDKFHDRMLAEEFHKALVKSGLIEEESKASLGGEMPTKKLE